MENPNLKWNLDCVFKAMKIVLVNLFKIIRKLFKRPDSI